MDTRPRVFHLPDTMLNWPWPRAMNPHFEVVKAGVDASFREFKALSDESQEVFDKCDCEVLRIGCDLHHIYLIVDEYTDIENAVVTQEMLDIVLDALHNPHKTRPEGECILGEIMRQFWARAIQTASPSSQRHFIEEFTAYLSATIVEATDREQGHCRSINDYLKLRRDTSAMKSTVTVCEMGMELPDEVFYHPVIVDLVDCIAELCLVDNDMISYNREQATGGESHNLITAIMLELGLDISGAMAWAARYHAEVQKRFMGGLAKVPSWGPSVDVLVQEYLDGIARWPQGLHCWSFETQRYFGTRGPEMQETGLVPLLPKVKRKDAFPVAGVRIVDLSKIMHHEQPSGVLEFGLFSPLK
ncbi:isoprenoid synthase domain-containing protein [Suillus discolor]|uniref:Terpene synthase n=1 Tax=Suillus discolor TaxID=1912936 RepID=A0A9P7EVR7_9AGAM|nr:isoprenoid synthase domain-containing protein [Suillus discolor]KAG2094003.1 isoprenoid synthase domain-containing protein [Suillus discolor]